MSQKLFEQLSRLQDDDLPAEELELLLKQVEKDPEMIARFARYSMVGDVISGHSVTGNYSSLLDGVNAAIDATDAPQKPSANRKNTIIGRFLKPLSGAAIAATVAAVVLVVLTDNGAIITNDPAQSIGSQTVASYKSTATQSTPFIVPTKKRSVGSGVSLVSTGNNSQQNVISTDDMEWQSMSPELRKKINNYIARHRFSKYTARETAKIDNPPKKAVGE